MFGLGFGEMLILAVVLLVVVGPRELPKLLRTLGMGVTKLRNMSSDLRAQSGIDDIIEDEGLRDDLNALRSLSSGKIIDGVVSASKPSARRSKPSKLTLPSVEDLSPPDCEAPEREQENPLVGCDAYGARADDDGEAENEGDAEDASPSEAGVSPPGAEISSTGAPAPPPPFEDNA